MKTLPQPLSGQPHFSENSQEQAGGLQSTAYFRLEARLAGAPPCWLPMCGDRRLQRQRPYSGAWKRLVQFGHLRSCDHSPGLESLPAKAACTACSLPIGPSGLFRLAPGRERRLAGGWSDTKHRTVSSGAPSKLLQLLMARPPGGPTLSFWLPSSLTSHGPHDCFYKTVIPRGEHLMAPAHETWCGAC